MAGEMGVLFDQVLQNPLILDIIVSNTALKDLYPLRQIAKMWKDAADAILRKRFILTIDLTIDLTAVDWIDKFIPNLEYFDSLKLSRLSLSWSENMMKIKMPIPAYYISQYGKRLKTLTIHNLDLTTEANFTALESILNSMPKLQRLYLQLNEINVPLFLNFNPEVSIDFVEVNCSGLDFEEENAETIVSQVLKIFKNLYSNLSDPTLDSYLLTHLSKRKKPMSSFQKLYFEIEPEDGFQTISLLETVNQAIITNLKKLCIYFAMPTNDFGISLKKCLSNFSQSLEKVTLYCTSSESEWKGNKVSLSLPPLRKLRTLKLGIPPITDGKPAFLWDLGKQLAKDFPLLEELKLPNIWHSYWDMFKYPEDWCIWEPFLPILGTDNVDLSPLKTVKKTEFCLPPNWVMELVEITWAKSILEVCNMLYPKRSHRKGDDISFMRENLQEHWSFD